MKAIQILFFAVSVFGASMLHAEKIKMGSEGAYAPFNTIDKNGKLAGFDIDIGNALCDAMDVECVWVTSDWDGIIPALLSKKIDTIIASMSITDERKKKIAFSGKYYTSPIKFAQTKGANNEISKKGLKGKVIGVQSGVVAEKFVTSEFGDVVKIKSYASQEELNLDFVSGRVDLIAADSFVLYGFLETKDGEFAEAVGPDFDDPKYTGEGIGIGIRQEDVELKDKLNKAIAQIRSDGTYKKINDKYFPFDVYGAE